MEDFTKYNFIIGKINKSKIIITKLRKQTNLPIFINIFFPPTFFFYFRHMKKQQSINLLQRFLVIFNILKR